MSKTKTTRYRVKQNQTDYYNKTYTLEEYVIKGGTNGYDGSVVQSGRVKIKEQDILNLIQFALEQRILVEKKKEGKQFYNYLKMDDKHQPNKKNIEADFIDASTAYEDSLSKPALDRLKKTGTTNTLGYQDSPDLPDTPF
jgi:hypothetical protein